MEKYVVGVDVGSTTIKIVVVDKSGTLLHSIYKRISVDSDKGENFNCKQSCSACGRCAGRNLPQMILTFLRERNIDLDEVTLYGVTGSQKVALEKHKDIGGKIAHYSEITCHHTGTRHLHPDAVAIIDVGGQDSKMIAYDKSSGQWNFQMSSICAAGTGGFLDTISQKLGVKVEDMGKLANLDTSLRLSASCAVFAATSINKFKNMYPLPDVIGAACRAQAETIINTVGSLSKSHDGVIYFQGGVAANSAVGHFLRVLLEKEIVVPKHYDIMGAFGAAILALEVVSSKENELARLFDAEDVIPAYTKYNERLYQMYGSENVRVKQFGNKTFTYKTPSLPFMPKKFEKTVWRNIFFPSELMYGFAKVRGLTPTVYAAMVSRDEGLVGDLLRRASQNGYGVETCSSLRVESLITSLPSIIQPDYMVTTDGQCPAATIMYGNKMKELGLAENFKSIAVPVTFSESSVAYAADEMRKTAADISNKLGIDFDEDRLRAAIKYSNEALHWFKKIDELRRNHPPVVPGHVMIKLRLTFNDLWGDPLFASFAKELYEYMLDKISKLKSPPKHNRIIWLHFSPFYSNDLLKFLERDLNSPLVMEEINYVNDYKVMNEDGDPFEAVASKMICHPAIVNDKRMDAIVLEGPKYHPDGVVLYNHFNGRCPLATQGFILGVRQRLDEIGMPFLSLDGDLVDRHIDPCSTRTKMMAFVESINAKKRK